MQPHSRSLVILLGALTGMTALSIDMSLPALPTLAAVFAVNADQAALTLSMFLAGYSVSQLFYGPIADRFGRRPPLLFGLALFAAGGVGCALSGSIRELVLWRLVQGVGACAGPILARTVVRDLYERRRGVQILSYMTLVMAVAPLLAPLIGGYLLLVHWRAIFGLLAVIGMAILAATWSGLPESIPWRDHRATRPSELLRHLVDFGTRRACVGYTFLVCFIFCGLFSYISGSPFVFIEVFGVASNRFGYLFGLSAFALMAGALINTRLVRRLAPARILRFGVALILIGGAAISACAVFRLGGVAGIVGSMLIYILGMGMVSPNAIAAAMEPVPRMAGFASSLIGCLQTAGGSLIGYVVGALYDRTAVPMALAVGLSAALAGITYFGFLGSLVDQMPAPNRHGGS
ncbi:MAG: Bcr/CflA family multidrug efflux MFS transporter [Stellaceae bacterium]